MASKSDWIFMLPVAVRSALAQTVLNCIKQAGLTQKEFRKLAKTNPKKAAKVKRKLVSCLAKRLKTG